MCSPGNCAGKTPSRKYYNSYKIFQRVLWRKSYNYKHCWRHLRQNCAMGGGVGYRTDSEDGESHVENLLHELYYEPQRSSAYTSIENVYRAARKLLPNIRRDIVERWFQRQLTATFHKPIRINFPTNKVFYGISMINGSVIWQIWAQNQSTMMVTPLF